MGGPVEAVVFAAGRGLRMRPLTLRRPKPLLPILDVALVDLALARIAPRGRTVVNAGYEAAGVIAHLAGRTGVEVLNEGDEPWGTAATLRALAPELDDSVLTYNCDLVGDLDIDGLVGSHERGVRMTLAVARVAAGADLEERPDGVVAYVDRRDRPDRAGYRFLGAAVVDRSAIEVLPEERPLGLAEALIAPAVAARDVGLYVHDGVAVDAGTPARFRAATMEALTRDLCDAPGVKIAVDGALAYLGPGAHAPPDSLGPGAVVLAGAKLEPGAYVEDSIVFPAEAVKAGTRLRAVILDGGRAVPA